MKLDLNAGVWNPRECESFMRSKERNGDLSNMSFGFPLTVNGLAFSGPEALYQALKFPNSPEVQKAIAGERSGMDAKRTSRSRQNLVDGPWWEEVKLDAMALTLAVKLAQHPGRFGKALEQTGARPIVEKSYRDPWWGAKPDRQEVMRGVNALGKLLTGLREARREAEGDTEEAVRRFLADAGLPELRICGKPVPRPGA